MAVFEVLGIACGIAVGSNNYNNLSPILFKGFTLLGIVFIISGTSFWFCEDILIFINIAKENAVTAGYMVRWLIPGMILQGINFQLQAFCMS